MVRVGHALRVRRIDLVLRRVSLSSRRLGWGERSDARAGPVLPPYERRFEKLPRQERRERGEEPRSR